MKPQGIVVIQGAYLGDLILSLPVISLLTRTLNESVAVVARAGAGEILKDVADISRIHLWVREAGMGEIIRLSHEIKNANYRIALIPHRILKAAFIPFWARIPHRVGFSCQPGWWLATNLVPYHGIHHEVQRINLLAKPLGIPSLEISYGLRPQPEIVEQAKIMLQNGGWHGQPLSIVAPGSFWPTKIWSAEGFAVVAEHFSDLGFLSVLVGSEQETTELRGMLERKACPHLDLGGKTDVRQLAAVISLATSVVANDSAPAHLGAALNVPTVAVFCGTSPDLGFAPYGPRAEAVWGGVRCSPCGRTGRRDCYKGTWECRERIKPEMVIRALQETFGKIVPTVRLHNVAKGEHGAE